MNQAWRYKGTESKLFNEDELKQAEADGWFDNRGDATKAAVELKSQEEADFQAELQKEEAEKLAKNKSGASSGATTFKE